MPVLDFVSYICRACGKTFPLNPPSIMQPHCCDPCGAIIAARQQADNVAKIHKARSEAFLKSYPPIYAKSNPIRFPTCWARVKAWRPNLEGRGLLLKGETGKCKTRMLWAFGLALACEGVGVVFVNEAGRRAVLISLHKGTRVFE